MNTLNSYVYGNLIYAKSRLYESDFMNHVKEISRGSKIFCNKENREQITWKKLFTFICLKNNEKARNFL